MAIQKKAAKVAPKKVAPRKATRGKTAPKKTAAARQTKSTKKKSVSPANAAAGARMEAPESGARIRMYRQGHGDCFLLAFRKSDGRPCYVLIDCGMKKGSGLRREMEEVVADVRAATDGHLDLVVITHEHEDHVSGFRSQRAIFETMRIDKLWLAWTEDPKDELADRLREKYKDTLLGLIQAGERLNGFGARGRADERTKKIVDSLLGFELSEEERREAAADPDKIKGRTNKEGIQVVKALADQRDGTEYLRPFMKPLALPGVPGARVFVLGPPRSEAKLKDLDPKDEETFGHLAAAAAEERTFFAALDEDSEVSRANRPFGESHRIPFDEARGHEHAAFFEERYGTAATASGDHAWRRIDGDWMRSSEQFALRMNSYVNNTSLVLAFELPNTGKTLLFVGDAQRGNWVSWHDSPWEDVVEEGVALKAERLLNRTVFYKVGHHGSHNATMNEGGLKSMAQGKYADEFVAMIPANEQWALTSNDPPWRHPLDAILKALRKKARGRVFVMDRDIRRPENPDVISGDDWDAFLARSVRDDLYYEYFVADDPA